MIKCEICGNEYKTITGNHLKFKHNITLKQYFKLFPYCETGYDKMVLNQKKTNLKRYGVVNVSHLDRVKEKIIRKNTGRKNSIETLKRMSKVHTGKILTDSHRKNISKNGKLSIEYIKRKFPYILIIEKMRYNPDKPGEKEIQVHCKNHNCPNSKEQGGWFTPTKQQLWERMRHIKNNKDGMYFYCSEECKSNCQLFNFRLDYFLNGLEDTKTTYTINEYETWKQAVLEQDDYTCQKCGSKENLNCHHIIPVKIEPMFSLDPDNGIVFCEECHYKYGHKTNTECSTGNLAKRRMSECQ